MHNPGPVAKLVYYFLFLFNLFAGFCSSDPALIIHVVGNQQLTYDVTVPLITKHLLNI